MTGHRNLASRPELAVTPVGEQSRASKYILHPADATDEELRTMWVRFEDCDSTLLEKTR